MTKLYSFARRRVKNAAALHAFDRARELYDLDRLRISRVLYLGCSGAEGLIEGLVRAGVGSHVLVDAGEYQSNDLSAGYVYWHEVGRPRVKALADRLMDVNPACEVIPVHASIDALADEDIEFILTQPVWHDGRKFEPEATLVCGFADDSAVQERVNRLALKLGIASLCSQVGREKRMADISFTHPRESAACHHCIQLGRDTAREGRERHIDTEQRVIPLFATTCLNTLQVFVALSLLHHGSEHPSWAGLSRLIGKRNHLRVRVGPNAFGGFGLDDFGALAADSNNPLLRGAVWSVPQPANGENGMARCPDCYGTGDLSARIGEAFDTRSPRG
jgi:hypothetical protein